MPDDSIVKVRKAIKRITPETVRGISSIPRRSNFIPAGVGPARASGSIQGLYPTGTLLPSSVLITQGYRPGHAALDLAGPPGTRVYAPETLRITQAGQGAFGIDVIGINPLTGNRFTFGHFASIAPGLAVGQVVPAGTLIGFEGSTFTAPGYSTGPHVHLQVNAPGGAAVMPSAQDILNTFVSGSGIPSQASPGVNVALLTTSPQVAASLASSGQVAQAVNSGGADQKAEKIPAASVISSPGVSGGSVTQAAASPLGFLASHKPLDYAFLAGGIFFVIVGIIILIGQMGKAGSEKMGELTDKVFRTKESKEKLDSLLSMGLAKATA